MRILIATNQVPFVRGGAELHAERLRDALTAAGHEAEIVWIPFKWYPPERILEQLLACRLLDLTESEGRPIDLLIGLKFPAYCIPHPAKVLWILHQHRQAYDLWSTPLGDLREYPNGALVRDAIRHADSRLIPEARAVFANSGNVAARLKKFCGIEAQPLYHPPPNAAALRCEDARDYFYLPSRLNPTKRQDLIVRALARTSEKVAVVFASSSDHGEYALSVRKLATSLGLEDRVTFLGNATQDESAKLYAQSLGVVYVPQDEDYGYVTLEAMLASKPVVTCTDSGGPLEFVVHDETGLVSEPAPEALAACLDEIWRDRKRARELGRRAIRRYAELNITWEHAIDCLLTPAGA